ncbi:MAG: metal ABC transporter substrate-binding protein [Pseudomonadota bacterium]
MIRLCLLILGLGLSSNTAALAAERTIAVVSAHLGDFAQRLGGDGVEVYFPVTGDRDPALWRPSVAEIGAIQSADLILLNGAEFARWTKRTSLPRARVVDTGRSLADRFIVTQGAITHSHGGDEAHSHDGIAPQLWLDFAQAQTQAEAVAASLSQRLGLDITAAAQGLSQDLAALDARAKAVVAGADMVLGAGPGFEYFLRAYAQRSATVADVAGMEAALADLTEEARASATVLLLTTSQSSNAKALINRAMGVREVVFDFGSAAGDAGFVARMNANLDRIEAALAR